MPLGRSESSMHLSLTKPTSARMMRPHALTGRMTPGEAGEPPVTISAEKMAPARTLGLYFKMSNDPCLKLVLPIAAGTGSWLQVKSACLCLCHWKLVTESRLHRSEGYDIVCHQTQASHAVRSNLELPRLLLSHCALPHKRGWCWYGSGHWTCMVSASRPGRQ
jgi:hypothetical protein